MQKWLSKIRIFTFAFLIFNFAFFRLAYSYGEKGFSARR